MRFLNTTSISVGLLAQHLACGSGNHIRVAVRQVTKRICLAGGIPLNGIDVVSNVVQ